MKEIQNILARVSSFAEGEMGILATVVSLRGSGYRLPGARMLILGNGQTVGTVSGGCLEADVLERAKTVLAKGRSEVVTYDTTDDENSVFSMNMGCRGVIEILLEPVSKSNDVISRMQTAFDKRESINGFDVPLAISLFGAGADAVPLVRIASELGWPVTVHDHRPAYLTEQRFPDAGELVLQVVDEPVHLAVDDRTAVVIMTHNYTRDRTILPTALRSNACYVGMLGPKSRTEQLIADLNNAGERFTPVQLVKLYAPVGLDIGATTPEGIALSIVGEIQSIFAKRDGGNLRDRIGSIYDRK